MSVNNLLYTTSRGAAIRPMIEAEVPNCVFYTRGGATLEELGQRAVNDLQWEIKPENCIVYFIAGLPSVTFRERDPNWGGLKYEEVIFNEPEDDAVARICNKIDSIAISVRSFKATPVFSTIIPMSLRVWNDVRLSQGKTQMLLHTGQYEDMQYFLNRAIMRVNYHIITTNVDNLMGTPHLFDVVASYDGSPYTPRIHYNRFEDGVHLKPEYSMKCATKLKTAMFHNRRLLMNVLAA